MKDVSSRIKSLRRKADVLSPNFFLEDRRFKKESPYLPDQTDCDFLDDLPAKTGANLIPVNEDFDMYTIDWIVAMVRGLDTVINTVAQCPQCGFGVHRKTSMLSIE